MSLSTPLLILAGAAGWGILSKLLDEQTRFKRRVVDEVAALLRKPDREQLQELLDPEQERPVLSCGHSPERRERRSRLDRLREQYSRLEHNARIVQQWADTEWDDLVRHNLQESYGPELCAAIRELLVASTEFRVAVRVALARIWLLSFLRFDRVSFVPAPSVAALARTGSFDILKAYRKVKDAALSLASNYGEDNEFADEIGAVM